MNEGKSNDSYPTIWMIDKTRRQLWRMKQHPFCKILVTHSDRRRDTQDYDYLRRCLAWFKQDAWEEPIKRDQIVRAVPIELVKHLLSQTKQEGMILEVLFSPDPVKMKSSNAFPKREASEKGRSARTALWETA